MSLGESIKLRREILGRSLRDVAEQIGVSHTTVNKYEKNILVPDSGSLIRLSDALQIPVASLLRPQSQKIQLNRFAFRSRKIRKKDEKQISAETKEWLERYLQLERLTDNRHTFTAPDGFPRTISTYEEAEEASVDLRKVWDLGTDPIENLTYLLEEKGIKIGIINGITRFDALFTEYEGDSIIVIKDNLPRARQRFSLAHELGHCLLEVEHGREAEKVMHRFAGAFLVPREKVIFELGEKRHKISVKELILLKEKYGLSMAAWLHRAMDLGIIPKVYYISTRKVFSKNGWNKKEPDDDVRRERPIFMTSLVLKSHAEGLISTSKAAELLNQSISKFCSLEGESELEQSAVLCG
jgi:Zn-dependent peptidase ImmA (M78 family)/transcriptional regulator with XRE-family HTH domain